MNASEDLRRRFQRAGRRPRVVAPRPEAAAPSADLPPGEEVITAEGAAYRLERLYPLRHEHGRWPLHAVLDYEPGLAADVAQQSGLTSIGPSQLAYIDTETTGLAGGAGTLVFLVGVGRFVDEGFRLRQYFLRDPAEEAAMLLALQEDLEPAGGFVSISNLILICLDACREKGRSSCSTLPIESVLRKAACTAAPARERSCTSKWMPYWAQSSRIALT